MAVSVVILVAFFVITQKGFAQDNGIQIDPNNVFQVPTVVARPTGAAILLHDPNFDPRIPGTGVARAGFGDTNYIPPQYDAFAANGPIVKLPEPKVDTAPSADFIVTTPQRGLGDFWSGTLKTIFIFDGSASRDAESSGNLEYRWDFESDGKIDSYFSRISRISHAFQKSGEYLVKLEVLDKGGNVSSMSKKVLVVENTPPQAFLTVDVNQGTPSTLFSFDTSFSRDSQYVRNALVYRFDWNSDGKWDTNFSSLTRWTHRFSDEGNYSVTMEVRDPEGASAQAQIGVRIFTSPRPVAMFNIIRGSGAYVFDASASTGERGGTQGLQYRWDFDYMGKNDIVFDSVYGYSPRFSGTYQTPGDKVVRLQVKDAEGQVAESFAKITAVTVKPVKAF